MIIKVTPKTKDWIEQSSKATGLDEKHVASALLSQAVEELKKKGLPLPLEKKTRKPHNHGKNETNTTHEKGADNYNAAHRAGQDLEA